MWDTHSLTSIKEEFFGYLMNFILLEPMIVRNQKIKFVHVDKFLVSSMADVFSWHLYLMWLAEGRLEQDPWRTVTCVLLASTVPLPTWRMGESSVTRAWLAQLAHRTRLSAVQVRTILQVFNLPTCIITHRVAVMVLWTWVESFLLFCQLSV